MNNLKSTYKKKYVDNADLYKGEKLGDKINQNLNKMKIIDLIEQFGELINDNPNIFRREKPIGKGEDGSPIQLYTLDKTKTEKPIILIVGGVHGDEKTSVYGIYETAKFLLSSNKWSRFITSNFVIQIVPCLNGYGYNNNKRNNSKNKDLNRDFIKCSQAETKALTSYINKNKDRIKIIIDSHNSYNEEFISCKQEMKYFENYEDIAFKLNLFLNGKYESDDKKSFLWISKSKNDGTLSDFINKNKFIGHTVESPRSLTKEIHYPNPINYEDGAEVTRDLLVNLMYIYGKMYSQKLLTESSITLNENDIDELQGFHGSQSDFNKFNHKKFLSSGAGSQVFGWGTYITDDVAIATDYANIGDIGEHDYKGSLYVNGKQYNFDNDNGIVYDFFKWLNVNEPKLYEKLIEVQGTSSDGAITFTNWFSQYAHKEIDESNFSDSVINEYKKMLRDFDKLNTQAQVECVFYLSFVSFIKQNEVLTYYKPQHKLVYEVDIPDNNGTNYIEWYEHFPKEFMVRVLQTMSSLRPKLIQLMCKHSYPFASHLGSYLQYKDNPNYNAIINAIASEDDYHTFFASGMYSDRKEGVGKDIYRALMNYMGSPKAASLFLMQCGFDGIIYPTGTRMAKPNGAKEDGLNYVIFDANKIKITNKTELS